MTARNSHRFGDWLASWGPAVAVFALHAIFASTYGIFRDELYYLSCAARLDWGYVDHPPLIAAVTALWTGLFGNSLTVIRLLPALAGAATVAVAGSIARRFGGGNFAIALTGLAVGLSPIMLGLTSVLTMNVFDLLFWALACRLVVALLDGGDERLWLAFGAVAGVGLLNKISMLFLGFGLVVGLVLARRSRVFRGRYLLAGWCPRGPALRAAYPVAESARLADPRVHPECQPDEERRPRAARFPGEATAQHRPLSSLRLADRARRPVSGGAVPALACGRFCLLRHPCRDALDVGQALLPGPGLSGAVGRRRGRDRSLDTRPAGSGRDALGHRCPDPGVGSCSGAAGAPHSPDRDLRPLCRPARSVAGHGRTQGGRASAAVLRRHAGLAGLGGGRRARRRKAQPRGAAARLRLRSELRRSERGRVFRPLSRSTAGLLRAQQLVLSGASGGARRRPP